MASAVTKLGTLTPGGTTKAEFTSISAAYDDLVIIGSGKSDYTSGSGTAVCTIYMRLNGDTTGGAYFWMRTQGENASLNSQTQGSWNSIYIPMLPTTYSSNTGWGHWRIDIPGYSQTVVAKKTGDLTGYGQATHGSVATIGNHGWTGTAAVNAVSIEPGYGSFTSGSSLDLYGIKNT